MDGAGGGSMYDGGGEGKSEGKGQMKKRMTREKGTDPGNDALPRRRTNTMTTTRAQDEEVVCPDTQPTPDREGAVPNFGLLGVPPLLVTWFFRPPLDDKATTL